MNLTKRLQEFTQRNMTLEDALPTKMPVYVNSIAYLFGVATLSALVMLIITGMILAIFGPNWYHVSATGRLFNSIHFWSGQTFFACIVLHMLTKLLLGAWRDGRWKTWMIGVLTLGVSIFAGFTGYLSATQLVFPVARGAGKGRHERHRHRGLFQHDELQPGHHAPRCLLPVPGHRPGRHPSYLHQE